MTTQTPKRQLKTSWLIAILATLALAGSFIIPLNEGMRALSYLLYFYICIEIGTQIYFSHKKKRDEEQKNKKSG